MFLHYPLVTPFCVRVARDLLYKREHLTRKNFRRNEAGEIQLKCSEMGGCIFKLISTEDLAIGKMPVVVAKCHTIHSGTGGDA
jgi:hypothetical protein